MTVPARTLERLAADLRASLGYDEVRSDEAVRSHHAGGESHHCGRPPDLVVFPGTTEEVVTVVTLCRDNSVPIIPYGSGTSLEGHVVALAGGVCLATARLNRILTINIDDMDVTVQAGVTRKQLDAQLRPEGVFFPVDPGADATIGGMIATGASGTTTVRYGAMRENVLSLIVVTADGRVCRTRSRARKSSAGYDLTRLFTGSEGTLGIITEATLKLYGTPEVITSAVCSFESLEDAVNCVMRTIQMAIPIARIELLDDVQMGAINRRAGLGYPQAPTLFLEFHGSRTEVREQARDVQNLAIELGCRDSFWDMSESERQRLWDARHAAYEAALALRPGAKGYITDVCVPISALARSIMQARAEIDSAGLVAPIVGHAGDGNFHVCFLVEPDDSVGLARVQRLAECIAERAIEEGGTCTGEHGIGYGKARLLSLEHGDVGIDLMRQIKTALDPNGLMNPGKIFPDRLRQERNRAEC